MTKPIVAFRNFGTRLETETQYVDKIQNFMMSQCLVYILTIALQNANVRSCQIFYTYFSICVFSLASATIHCKNVPRAVMLNTLER